MIVPEADRQELGAFTIRSSDQIGPRLPGVALYSAMPVLMMFSAEASVSSERVQPRQILVITDFLPLGGLTLQPPITRIVRDCLTGV